jgi:hypothetical protein
VTPPLKPLPKLTEAEKGTAAGMAKMLAGQVGYREGPNNDQAFGVWYGFPNVAWCAQFQSWGAAMAGVGTDVIPKHQYTPTGWGWFNTRGQGHTVGQVGDLCYVYYSSIGRIGHVAFVERIETTSQGVRLYHTIEGNTNDSGSSQGIGVFRLIRAQTGNLHFGRPNYHQSSEGQDDDLQPITDEGDDDVIVLLPEDPADKNSWLLVGGKKLHLHSQTNKAAAINTVGAVTLKYPKTTLDKIPNLP